MDFYRIEDARSRLMDGLLRIKGCPVVVLDVNETGIKNPRYAIDVKYLETGKIVTVPFDDKVDVQPVPLGNTNYKGEAYYVMRQPARMWKQGLTEGNIVCRSLAGGYTRLPVQSKCLIDTIKGEYPSIKEAFKEVDSDKANTCAFSRNFSIDNERSLIYNSRVIVGTLKRNNKDFLLFDEFFYLKELLQEAIAQ